MSEENKTPVIYKRSLNPLYWCGAAISELSALVWRVFIQAPYQGLSHGVKRNNDLGKFKIGLGMVIVLNIVIIALILI